MIQRLSKANLFFYALVGGFVVVVCIGGIEAVCGSKVGKGLMRFSYQVSGK
jgi:hypothetical protein